MRGRVVTFRLRRQMMTLIRLLYYPISQTPSTPNFGKEKGEPLTRLSLWYLGYYFTFFARTLFVASTSSFRQAFQPAKWKKFNCFLRMAARSDTR